LPWPGLSVGVDGAVDVGVESDVPGEFTLLELAGRVEMVDEFVICPGRVEMAEVEE
jgi:hypothetical protein